MSRSAKSASPAGASPEELSFEDALKRLESLVESMESDDLPLEALLTRFEEGTRLVRVCQAKLAEADLKIAQLEQNSDGSLSLKPIGRPEPTGNE
jgi:exodeoxyribonuclease VII small subunit